MLRDGCVNLECIFFRKVDKSMWGDDDIFVRVDIKAPNDKTICELLDTRMASSIFDYADRADHATV
jgi:hypothetical protein